MCPDHGVQKTSMCPDRGVQKTSMWGGDNIVVGVDAQLGDEHYWGDNNIF